MAGAQVRVGVGDHSDRPATTAVADADALASRGHYAAAIHALLLAAEDDVERRVGPLPSSWTSREIVHHRQLPEASRAALRDLVRTGERSHFGRRPGSARHFDRCRDSYQQFLQHLGSPDS